MSKTYRATVQSIEGVNIEIVDIPQWIVDYWDYCRRQEERGILPSTIAEWGVGREGVPQFSQEFLEAG